ncbi:hypothetical protein IVB12_07900 [Bradyrhizobium sp. 179]|uniref:hypothetical protein n=1 Tax=Bradyrhizobium sp. 179 TaxID=2782648 RepID=UPI001FFA0F1B|nr:hypothetical protein [Bradyrhizobium sp. 179]MCK1541897.1 hypothetical protein [Bradyrhizobium sp. 179]
MSDQAVGWLCGAFSNPENFSTAAAQTFVSALNNIGAGISFVYPGNAKNTMIETTQGAQYIERSMLAAIYGHGNVFGPDVEYVPHIRPAQFPWHVWGGLGVLRWVFIGGCDALAFPLAPDGRPFANSDQAPPMRWNGTLSGISGMCGYRSESWYVPGFQAMMPLMDFEDVGILQVGSGYAQTLVNAMGALNTFWSSWIQAASWLHNQLNHQAQPACYVNRPESLNEHLKNYLWNRQSGLDVNSIQTVTIGTGTAPQYEPGFCPTCDANGHANCPPFKETGAAEFNSIAFYGVESAGGTADLPIFEYTFDDVSLALVKNLGRGLQIDGLSAALAMSEPSATSSGILRREFGTNFSIGAIPSVQGGAENLSKLFRDAAPTSSTVSGVELRYSEPQKQQLTGNLSCISMRPSLTLDEQIFPVLLDNGLTVWDSLGVRSVYGSVWRLVGQKATRRIPTLASILETASLALPPHATRVVVVANEICYVKAGTAFRGQLVPTRRVSMIVKGYGGFKQAIVVLG